MSLLLSLQFFPNYFLFIFPLLKIDKWKFSISSLLLYMGIQSHYISQTSVYARVSRDTLQKIQISRTFRNSCSLGLQWSRESGSLTLYSNARNQGTTLFCDSSCYCYNSSYAIFFLLILTALTFLISQLSAFSQKLCSKAQVFDS